MLLLGRPRLEVDGQALAAELPLKHQALLFFLAAADGPVSRAELATLLWEAHDEAAARGNLRSALMRLRRVLPGVLVADGRQIGFDPAMPVKVDWAELARAASGDGAFDRRCAAAQAWRGPLLEGFDVGTDAFDQWLTAARARAQRQAVTLRRALATEAAAAGQTREAEAHWRALLEVDDVDEEAHVALMQLLAESGRRTAAIAQYEACRAALAERLGARPSATSYAAYTVIHADSPVATVGSARPANKPVVAQAPQAAVELTAPAALDLPEPEGPLIGREAEMALLTERLTDDECRWLTVVGPGGMGKTRLVLAAARGLASRFRHGMLWISSRDLGGGLRDAEAMARHVLTRTGSDRGAPCSLLLVLDNLETNADPAALARGLQDRAPGVCVLATSRRRLGVPREWLLELNGLSLARMHPDAAATSAAARLLAAAVRRLEPRFDPVAEAEGVEALCELVGGLPLALELAARGVLDAGLPAVLERVTSGVPLEDRGRDVRERQHSIEVVMRDSWALLPDDARAAALRLAWLPGAIDLPLAEAIGVPAAAVGRLREHSWLRRTDEGTLALHPLQQDFLRRWPTALALRTAVRAALATAVREALPPLAPFARWPDGLALPAGKTLFSASVLTEALDPVLNAPQLESVAEWVDGAVALLMAADRYTEVAAMLARADRRTDLPVWRRAGWRMQRADALNMLGEALASMDAYESALADLGLDAATRDGGGWRHLPVAIARAWRRCGWPDSGPERAAFDTLLLRSLSMHNQQLSFTSSMNRSVRANLLTSAWLLSTGLRQERRAVRVMSAYGTVSSGQAGLARWLLKSVTGRQPLSSDPLLEAFTREGECVVRIALGQWAGVTDELQQVLAELDRRLDHRHAMECLSLTAKLLFFQGQLRRSADRFAEATERSLRRPGGAWRAWGPLGQAEVALCMGDAPSEQLEHWVVLGSHWMTEMQNLDAAYVLRRFGLVARLAWRRGDADHARDAVLGGVAAASRIAHCGFWAHEGFAGIGEVLLNLRSREQRLGGAVGPLDDAWRILDRRLERHARSFPAGRAMVHRLRGQAAHAAGRHALASRWLHQAVLAAEAQGMRVELARSCETLAAMESTSPWSDRARRLWREMGVGFAAAAVDA